jgi:hypothetical protein
MLLSWPAQAKLSTQNYNHEQARRLSLLLRSVFGNITKISHLSKRLQNASFQNNAEPAKGLGLEAPSIANV